MAAPTINFVDPVGVTPQAPWDMQPPPAPVAEWFGYGTAYGGTPENNLASGGSVILGIPIAVLFAEGVEPPPGEIPAPPMGQIYLNTFPSIYRTRGALPFGQIHPPPVPKE